MSVQVDQHRSPRSDSITDKAISFFQNFLQNEKQVYQVAEAVAIVATVAFAYSALTALSSGAIIGFALKGLLAGLANDGRILAAKELRKLNGDAGERIENAFSSLAQFSGYDYTATRIGFADTYVVSAALDLYENLTQRAQQ